ncbi:hypothetical protein ACP4OV_025546 [Aristida adscensionis]
MSTGTVPMARCAAGRVKVSGNAAVSGRRRTCVVAAAAAAASVCPEKIKSDYYAVLSLEHSPAVGAAEIRRAYRRLARRYHPDACPPARRAESTELFLELRRAYETLSDPARRVRYDAELRTTTSSDVAAAAARPAGADAFARDVWEAQLRVLRARSEQRQRARGGGGRPV